MDSDAEHANIRAEVIREKAKPRTKRSPWLGIIIGTILVLMLIVWFIPAHAFPPQARPGNVPIYAEVVPDFQVPTRPDNNNINNYIIIDPTTKLIASRVVSATCSSPDNRCYADALFYFVRDNIHYVNDPIDEYYELPHETLLAQGADCDGTAILLASLLNSVGVPTRFAYAPRHVYVEAWVDKRGFFTTPYSREWIPLDATCGSCRPGALHV